MFFIMVMVAYLHTSTCMYCGSVQKKKKFKKFFIHIFDSKTTFKMEIIQLLHLVGDFYTKIHNLENFDG